MAGDCCVGGLCAGDCCVDLTFCLVWSRCPCTIAADGGGYFRTSLEVISGSDVRNPSSSASHRVESAGNPIVPWRKAIHWAIAEY